MRRDALGCVPGGDEAGRVRPDDDQAPTENLNPNITNAAPVVNPVRERQINLALTRLRADFAKAQAAKTKACKKTPKVWTLADYNGTYTGGFTNSNFILAFTVDDGNVTGDITSTSPLNPATGNVTVQPSFAGATCPTATLHIDPATGEAKTTADVTCHMSGLSRSGQIDTRRTAK